MYYMCTWLAWLATAHQGIGVLVGVQVVDEDRHVCRIVT